MQLAQAAVQKLVDKIDDAYVAERDERRTHLGASVMGRECMRAVWYEFHWAVEKKFPGRILRLFDRGQREEDRFVAALRKAGATVHTVDPKTGKQYRYNRHGGHMGGSQDALISGIGLAGVAINEWVLGEFKTHNYDSFKALAGEPRDVDCHTSFPDAVGVRMAKPEHYAQMQSYMKWSGIHRCLYMAVCKDNDDIYTELVEFDADYAEHIEARGEEIIFTADLPPKIGTDASQFQCKFCDFSKVCHGRQIPEKNCRTCAHSTPEKDGDARWSCTKYGDIPKDFTGESCHDHVFNPTLLVNQGDYIGGNSELNYAEYRRADGTTFKNGTKSDDVIPSDELAHVPLNPTPEEILLHRTFGAKWVKPMPIDPAVLDMRSNALKFFGTKAEEDRTRRRKEKKK